MLGCVYNQNRHNYDSQAIKEWRVDLVGHNRRRSHAWRCGNSLGEAPSTNRVCRLQSITDASGSNFSPPAPASFCCARHLPSLA